MTSFEDVIERIQQAKTPERVISAMDELIEYEDEASLPILEELCFDNEVEIQAHALKLLGHYQGGQVNDILLQSLQETAAWDVRMAAADSLAKTADAQAIEKLGELLNLESDWDLVTHIIQILGKIGQEDGLTLILSFANHSNAFVRKSVATALNYYPWNQDIENQLIKMLGDESEHVVIGAIQSLANSSSTKILKELKKLSSFPHLSDNLAYTFKETIETIENRLKEALDGHLPPQERLNILTNWVDSNDDHTMTGELSAQLKEASQFVNRLSQKEQSKLLETALKLSSNEAMDAQQNILQEILKAETPLEEFAKTYQGEQLPDLLLKIARQNDSSDSEKRGALITLQQMPLNESQLQQMFFLFDESDWLFELSKPIFISHKKEITESLTNYLKNNPPNQAKGRMFELLGEFQEPQNAPILIQQLKDEKDPSLISTLKQALVNTGTVISDFVLESMHKSPEHSFKKDCLEILALWPPLPQSSELLVFMLNVADSESLEIIVELLGRLDSDCEALIIHWFDENSGNLTRESARKILKLRGQRSLPHLISCFPNYISVEEQKEALASLIIDIIRNTEEVGSSVLLPLLKHQKDALKLSAINMISAIGDHDTLEELCLQLRAHNKEISGEVKRILPQWGSSIIPFLLTLLEKHSDLYPTTVELFEQIEEIYLTSYLQDTQTPLLQASLIEALGSRPQVDPGLFSPYLQSQNLTVLKAAILAVRKHKSSQSAQAILALLEHTEQEVRIEALYAAGDLELEEATPHVDKYLNSAQFSFKQAAVYAVGRLKAIQFLPILLQFLKADNTDLNAELKATTIQALGYMSVPEALPPLEEMLLIEKTSYIVHQLLEAISQIRLSESVDILTRYFEKQTVLEIKEHILRLIGKMDMSEGYTFIVQYLPEWNIPLQRVALSCLGNTSQAWVLPTLLQYLENDEWKIQRSAVEALGNFAHMEALNPLKDKLQRVQSNHHTWGWILRSAIYDAIEKIRASEVKIA